MNIVINQLVKNFSLTSFSIGFFKNYLSDWQIACIQAPGIQGLAVDSDWLSTQNAIGAVGRVDVKSGFVDSVPYELHEHDLT